MIFTILCFTENQNYHGYFLVFGVACGSHAVLNVFEVTSFLGLLGGLQESLQTWTVTRYFEITSLSLGLALARKKFERRSLILTTIVYSFCTGIAIFSIFWWKVFPLVFNNLSHEINNFNQCNERFFTVAFTVLTIFLHKQKNCFHPAVFRCLLASMFLRIAMSFTSAFLIGKEPGPFHSLVLFLKIISSAFELYSIGLSRLLRPYEILENRVKVQRSALATEKLFAEWIIEQVAVLMVFLDLDGRIMHSNQFAEKTLKDCHGKHGTNFFETIAPDHKDIASKLKDMKTMESVRFTAKCDSKSVEWTASVLSTIAYREKAVSQLYSPDEVPDRVVLCIGQDITDAVNRENLLLQAKSDAEKLSAMKDTFVQNVSHELRTPLNCILGVTGLLLQTPLSPQQTEMTDMIFRSSGSLINVINDLLDFSKLQYGKVKLEPIWVDIRKVLEDILVSVSVLYQTTNQLEFGYRISKDCPKMLFLDEKRLRQILMNLLSNAIKFTKKGHIMIYVRKGPPSALQWDSVEFRVSDTGIQVNWVISNGFRTGHQERRSA